MEVWKDIPEYEGLYQISNIGRVKSFHRKTPIIMKPKDYGPAYAPSISLHKDGVMTNRVIPCLVLEAFVPKPGEHYYMRQKSFDRSDIRLENLEWVPPFL